MRAEANQNTPSFLLPFPAPPHPSKNKTQKKAKQENSSNVEKPFVDSCLLAENKEVLAKLKGMKGASKNTVKRPMPKLDSIR